MTNPLYYLMSIDYSNLLFLIYANLLKLIFYFTNLIFLIQAE